MRLSELYGAIGSNEELLSYTLWLAAPDRDGNDVDLASVGRVDVNYQAGQARLYPASTSTNTDSVDPEPFVDIVLSNLPRDVSGDNDLAIVVETPLLRDESENEQVRFTDLVGIHVGNQSQEVWFLLRPAAEFAAGLLPD